MSRFKLKCNNCAKELNAKAKTFPKKLVQMKKIEEDGNKSMKMVPVIVGYVCVKCVGKMNRDKLLRQHKIKPDKTGKKTIARMLHEATHPEEVKIVDNK